MLVPMKQQTPEWYDYKRERISATDVASITGAPGAYETALDVWARLTGKIDKAADQKPTFAMERGNRLEKPILEWWADTKEGVREVQTTLGIFQHDSLPWLMSSPDALARCEHGVIKVAEAKSPGTRKERDWDWDVALNFKVQLQINLECGNIPQGVIIALLSDSLIDKEFEHDQKSCERIIDVVNDWREKYVLKDIQPPAIARDDKLLRSLRPKDDGTCVALPLDVADVARRWNAVREQRLACEKQEKALKATLQQVIGDHAYAVVDEDAGEFISFKGGERKMPAKPAYTVTSRSLRYTKNVPAGLPIEMPGEYEISKECKEIMEGGAS